MGNRMSSAVGALKRRKRAVVNTVSVGAIGALALGTLGTGVATAHGMVGSPQIKDQSINSWDIGHNQVGSSELRGPAHDSGPAVASHHVQDQSLGHWDIKDQTLGHWDIKDGTIGEWDLNEEVTDRLNTDKTAQTDSVTDQLDEQVNVGQGEPSTTLESLEVAAGTFVTANVTLHSFGSNDHAVCFITGPSGNNLAEANPHLGGEQGSVHLSGVTQEAGEAQLKCHGGSTEGQATDISMASVN